MAWGAARFPLPRENTLWPAGGGLCSGWWGAVSPSHLTHTWRASPQVNSTLKSSPKGPWAEAELCPGALAGAGRSRGAGGCWDVYGLSATGQGCWVAVRGGCCAPQPRWIWGWTLSWVWGWILGRLPNGGARTGLLAPLVCRVWKRVLIKLLGPAVLPAIQGAGEEPAPPHRPETSIPQAVPAGPIRSGLAGCSPHSPGSKGSGGWSSAVCRQ